MKKSCCNKKISSLLSSMQNKNAVLVPNSQGSLVNSEIWSFLEIKRANGLGRHPDKYLFHGYAAILKLWQRGNHVNPNRKKSVLYFPKVTISCLLLCMMPMREPVACICCWYYGWADVDMQITAQIPYSYLQIAALKDSLRNGHELLLLLTLHCM